MTNQNHTTVKHVARWTFQEVLPIIILLGISGLMWVLYATQSITEIWLAIALSGIFFGFAALVIYVSARRKWKSTLFAELSNDKNYNIEIWMRKPLKEKWKGRMDRGNNKGALATIVGADFDNIEGTPVMLINLKSGKPLTIPNRLAETTALKTYLGSAVSKQSNKLKFRDAETGKTFASFLILPDASSKLEEPEIEVDEVEEDTDISNSETTTEKKQASSPTSVEEEIVAFKPKKQINLDYSEYERPVVRDYSPVLNEKDGVKVTSQSIARAVEAKNAEIMAEPKDIVEENINLSSDLFTGLGVNGSNSISIDLGETSTPEDKSAE
jgi:hypothetical protein